MLDLETMAAKGVEASVGGGDRLCCLLLAPEGTLALYLCPHINLD